MTLAELIADIAIEIGVTAEIMDGCIYAEPAAPETETIRNEAARVDEWPGDDWAYDQTFLALHKRREEITAIFQEEPLTKEEAEALIDELAEIETRLQVE